MECGCYNDQYQEGSGEHTVDVIHYCPLHKAAPELLEICKEIWFEPNRNCLGPILRKALVAAIAKAETKEE